MLLRHRDAVPAAPAPDRSSSRRVRAWSPHALRPLDHKRFSRSWSRLPLRPRSRKTPSSGAGSALADGVYNLLVGTYTGGKSEGLYVYRFDTKTGDATRVSVAQTVNPSCLVVSRDRRFVYAVNELPGDNGPASQRGGVSAFRFDAASGQLTFLNKVSADGQRPVLPESLAGRQISARRELFGRGRSGRQLLRFAGAG